MSRTMDCVDTYKDLLRQGFEGDTRQVMAEVARIEALPLDLVRGVLFDHVRNSDSLAGNFKLRSVYVGWHPRSHGATFKIIGMDLISGMMPRFTIMFPDGSETQADYLEVFERRL